ncbi:MAG: hypothetical protein PF486_05040 [Prolixibacteraceae bacterium]|jgi:fibronectin type 3 domain-containing protein|nr:hypothetical protein [Prolixibacteraceae bacterium]
MKSERHILIFKMACNSLMVMIVLLVCVFQSKAQGNTSGVEVRKANLHLIAQPDADSVVLRWAPSTAGGWIVANQLGFTVERIKIDENIGVDDDGYETLNEAPLMPMLLDDWKAYAGPDNHLSAIAAQAVYGDSFIPEPLNQNELSVLKNAADELTNRYSFALFAADNDAVTANALGLRYVDREVEPGERYAYRVFVSQTTNEYRYDTAYVILTVEDVPKWPSPGGLEFESGDGSIKLKWDESALYPFSGYYVYRSDDGGSTYQKMNKIPLVVVSTKDNPDPKPFYTDTSTINYSMYHYQILGITPFGGLSEAAEIKAYSKDMTPPLAPHINKTRQISSSQVKVSWKMQDVPDDLKGFFVARSAGPVDGFKLLHNEALPKNTFEYTDNILGETEAYYSVAAVDTAGNLSFSPAVMSVFIDTIPPSVPQNLSGIIDSAGKVTLTWDLGPEKNITGYRVLRANAPDHEFLQLTGHVHPDTVFIDSVNINTLTRYVYYRIAAVNNRFQHSEMSGMLKLRRPDVLPPDEAVFHDVFVTDTCVNLKWYCSGSDDVAGQNLYRRDKPGSDWDLLASLEPGVSFYTDSDVLTHVKYYYTLTSVDSSGLVSNEAFPVAARPYDTGYRQAIENLDAQYNDEDKTVLLEWSYKPLTDERFWFVIYKSINGGNYKLYKAVDGDERNFVDKFPTVGESGYGVMVKTSSGGMSDMVKTTLMIQME